MLVEKKIAIVVNSAWNIYNFRLGLVKELIQNGFRVIAIAPIGDFVKQIEEVGCKFVELNHLNRKGKNPIHDILLISELARIYKKEEIDVVLHYTIKPVIYGTLATYFSRAQSINTMTGLGYSFLSTGFVNKTVLSLYRFSLRNANKVFFQNRDDLKLFLKKKLVAKEKTGIIDGSGIDSDYFVSNDYPDSSELFNVLFVGRLLKDKGIFEFVEAARKVIQNNRRIIFNIVGDLDTDNPTSITQKELQEWEAYPWIKYHGIVRDIRPHVEKANVVVLPSYREGVPRALLEGMSMARPIVTTDVPGCRETVIDGESGYMVPVKNVTALVEALERMICLGHDEKIEMGRKGRELVLNRFDEKIIIQKYLLAIKDLLEKTNNAN